MGLLSDPEYGSVKWVKVLKKVHAPVCFLCYVGAIVWFLLLGHREFNNETYFSENALLPGLVTNEFNGESAAKQFYNEFMLELEDKYEDNEEIPVPWLVAKLSQLHLDVYTHNFTLHYPMGKSQKYKGTNVYGILRAARTPSLEAVVVSAPYRSLFSHQTPTHAGIALMLAFAQFARPQKYWAKDIIFLITEHEQLGMQAWLEAYHGIGSNAETFYSSLGSFWSPGNIDISKYMPGLSWNSDHEKCLKPGKLKGRSGSIQAAINLEFESPKLKYIEVKVEGLNGQLPNLDLVNLVHKLCVKSGIHHAYKSSYSWVRPRNKMEEWKNGVWTLLEMATTQITGVPSGNHGLFHRFNIEAVTLEGREEPPDPAVSVARLSSVSFHRVGVLLESVLRSLNNLLERFHQSYFFYLLPATNRFVSIGQYMPSLCLMCVAMLVRALYLWVTLQDDEHPDDKTESETQKRSDDEPERRSDTDLDERPDERKETAAGTPNASQTKVSGVTKREERKGRKGETPTSIATLAGNYLFVHLFGFAVANSPGLFSRIGAQYWELPAERAVYYGVAAAMFGATALGPTARRAWPAPPTRREATLTALLALLELATLCLAVGMHNFPLGLLLGALYAPLALAAAPVAPATPVTPAGRRRRRTALWRRALCLALLPLATATLATVACGRVLAPQDSLRDSISRGIDAAMQALMFSIVDSMIYGNWLFNVLTCALLPIWILFWQILSYTSYDLRID